MRQKASINILNKAEIMKNNTYFINSNKSNTISSNNNSGSTTTSYSKDLTDLIFSNIKKKNPYFFDDDYKKPNNIIIIKKKKNDEDDFLKAAIKDAKKKKYIILNDNKKTIIGDIIDYHKIIDTITNYKNNGPSFYLGDIPITFFEDEIQIGYDIFAYDDLLNEDYFFSLPEEKKNILLEITIEINK